MTATGASVLIAQPATADYGAFLDGFHQDLVVDDAHRRIFVSQEGPDAVVVIDFNGRVVQTLTGFTKPRDLSISPDGSTVYVAEHDTPSLGVIDAETYTVDKVELPAEQCVWSTAWTGGKLWYSYRDCAAETGSIGSYDPATGETTGGAVSVQAGELQARPDRPDRLFLLERPNTDRAMHVHDVSGGSPVQVSASAPGSMKGCMEAALFAGGDKVALACPSRGNYQVFNTADLSPLPQPPGDKHVMTVAVSPDDRFVATGTIKEGGKEDPAAVSVWDLQNNAFVTRRAEYDSYYSRENSLAFTADDKLIRVLHYSWANRYSVEIMDRIATGATALTLETRGPSVVGVMDTVRFYGTLHRGPGAGTTLSVQRRDPAGTHTLPAVTVDESGMFAFVDSPGQAGAAQYTVSFAGDADHRPATNSTSVHYRGLRGDVNRDGYVDVVAGAPGEDIGDDTDTGQIHLLFGSANGFTTTGNKAVHQDTANVSDSNEDGDRFGHASAFGDFDADGYSDLAVSAPGEDIGSVRDVGMVFVFRGTPSGLQPDWSTVYRPQTPVANMAYGTSLTVGDFDGDHRDDLAVGAPGAGAGSVFVHSADFKVTEYDQDWFDMPGYGYEGEQFGRALDAGDVDGDGLDDLAIGEVYDEDLGRTTGAVTVLMGRPLLGLGTTEGQRFTKDTPGVPGAPGSFNTSKGDLPDLFGHAVALADFNGDGKDDLAVGAPGSAVTGTDGERKADAGTLTVLYSDGSRIGTAGAVELTQKSAGLPGNPGADDRWGTTIAAGDSDHDGRDELVVHGAGEDFVSVIPGGTDGLVYTGAKAWSQDSPGVPGGSEAGDRWGTSLRFADVKGTGHLSLIVGAPGEDTGAGAFTVLHATASGITGTGAQFFSQDTTAIPGAEEKNDGFGALS
ncbi:hypothetical protein AB0I28_19815 [Phytomonospora sp. NPDC050363]|uniref:hypothetical protein n=1 Tax=Phytomonospora sp. NPDC050363 TaxID=3155642 RepID=UPI0033CA3FB3